MVVAGSVLGASGGRRENVDACGAGMVVGVPACGGWPSSFRLDVIPSLVVGQAVRSRAPPTSTAERKRVGSSKDGWEGVRSMGVSREGGGGGAGPGEGTVGCIVVDVEVVGTPGGLDREGSRHGFFSARDTDFFAVGGEDDGGIGVAMSIVEVTWSVVTFLGYRASES